MPKSKKKKVKHQDFAKVKLKVGKRLPRAANETDASFKSRGIQLKEQFKDDKSQPSTKRKLSLVDLLNQCHHYSASVRRDAVTGLKELLSGKPHVINQNLSVVVDGCVDLLVDHDSGVRDSVFQLLKIICSSVPTQQMIAYFPVLSVHLSCAMTHIYEDIQADSLQVLDLFIEKYPELVVADSSQLMPNFLDQISKQTESSMKSKQKMRTLVVNPSSKVGNQKWRYGVLGRLSKLLKAMFSEKHKQIKSISDEEDSFEENWKSSKGFQPISGEISDKPLQTGFRLSKHKSSGKLHTDPFSSLSYLQKYMTTIVPVLLECWVEIGPAAVTDNEVTDNTLNPQALGILGTIIEILVLLLKYASCFLADGRNEGMAWIEGHYRKEFERYFMVHFPYAVHENAQMNKAKDTNMTNRTSVHSLNLSVCELMTYFLDRASKTAESFIETITSYLNQQLTQSKQTYEQLKVSLDITDKVLHHSQSLDGINSLLETLFFMGYKKKHPQSKDFRCVLEFFAKHGLSGPLLKDVPVFATWIQSLPHLLKEIAGQNESLSSFLLHIMKDACAKRNGCFLENFDEHLSCLIDPELVVKLTHKQQRSLVEMVYSAPQWQRENLRLIAKLLLSNVLLIDTQVYLLEILNQRIKTRGNHVVSLTDYLSFLFTILVCKTSDDGMTPSDEIHTRMSEFWIHTSQDEYCYIDVQLIRVRCIVDQLQPVASVEKDALYQAWTDFVTVLLRSHETMTLRMAVSILEVTLSLTTDSVSPFQELIGQLLLATMATIVAVPKETTSDVNMLQKVVQAVCQQCLKCIPGLWTTVIGLIRHRLTDISSDDILLMVASLHGCSENLAITSGGPEVISDLRRLLDSISEVHPSIKDNSHYAALQYASHS